LWPHARSYCWSGWFVLAGQVWLELDDGQLTRVRAGDTVVQNGTRHAWRNLSTEPVTLAVVQVGMAR
jgi:quercetin dioxygenase-like cupin family protein